MFLFLKFHVSLKIKYSIAIINYDEAYLRIVETRGKSPRTGTLNLEKKVIIEKTTIKVKRRTERART